MPIFLEDRSLFHHFINRDMPCIVCFFDPSDDLNHDIIKTIEGLCRLFPYVFCYIADWVWYLIHPSHKTYLRSNFVYEFKSGGIVMAANGNSESEVFKIFQYVFQECIHDHFQAWKRQLKIEKRVPPSVIATLRPPILTKFDRIRPSFTPHPPYKPRNPTSILYFGALEYQKRYDDIPFTIPNKDQRNLFFKQNNTRKTSLPFDRKEIHSMESTSSVRIMKSKRKSMYRFDALSSYSKDHKMDKQSENIKSFEIDP